MQIHEHVMLEDDSNFDHSQTCAIKLDASTSHMLKKNSDNISDNVAAACFNQSKYI